MDSRQAGPWPEHQLSQALYAKIAKTKPDKMHRCTEHVFNLSALLSACSKCNIKKNMHNATANTVSSQEKRPLQ